MPKAAKSKGKRTHVLGGCQNCRTRHVKCDQGRPTCTTCSKAGLACNGYATEEARASMSSVLASRVNSTSVHNALSDVDARGRRAGSLTAAKTDSGPFGVIDFQQGADIPARAASDDVGALAMPDQATDVDMSVLPAQDIDIAEDSHYAALDFSLQWDDIFALDFEQQLANGTDDIFLMDLTPELLLNAVSEESQEAITSDNGAGMLATLAPSDRKLPQIILDQSQVLLKHFHDSVIPSMASLPFGIKSPWKIQNLARAAQTFAELTYLDLRDVKHAKISNLYGMFACSAYQMSTLQNRDGDWDTILNIARHAAKKHLQISLRDEMSGPGKAKYKDQLCAMLSLVTLAVISGSKDDARRLIIDTERLLRTRGLAKKFLSRKCRMLHHCYTWTRIIGESTYVLHDYTAGELADKQVPVDRPHPISTQNQQHPCTPESCLDNFLRIETQNDIADGPKPPEVGLLDIHLDDPRDDQATMYDNIYGLPEAWLSLLSRTTKLANVIDAWKLSEQETSDLTMPVAFQKRAKLVESMVCSFAARDTIGDPAMPNYHMIKALTAALVIYFYRRIRDVNSWIMQSHVDNVISSLKDYDQAIVRNNMSTPGTAWPAFIAGCEASSKMRREALVAWTDKAYVQTGLAGYKAAGTQMREVWRRRDAAEGHSNANLMDTSGTTATWMSVSRDQDQWILLC